MAAITVTGLSHGFGGVNVLSEVSLSIEPGQFVALLGPSGSGKSTLLRLVNGLLLPGSGEISIGGQSPPEARRAKRFALVPQTPALLPWRSVRANVALVGEVNRRSGVAAPSATRIDELLASVGLMEFADARPHTLSGGMQQRVALVRAVASSAPILLLDEPFAALDEITRTQMRSLLLELWAQSGATAIFVTHSIAEAVVLSDRVIVISDRPGRVVADVAIDLPRPRHEEMQDSLEFTAYTARVRRSLHEGFGR